MALDVLNKVFTDKAYVNIVLDEYLLSSRLKDLDRSLVTAMVYGTISKKITLEWYLNPFVKKVKPWVKCLLLLSLYQIVFMDKIPTSAAVDEAVKLAKKIKGHQVGGFVNGVLRNFSRTPLRQFEEIVDKIERLGIQYSMPNFLVEKLIVQFGFDRTKEILESLEEPSKVSIRINTQLSTISEIMTSIDGLNKSSLSAVGLVTKYGNFAQTQEFKEGKITIQDETSQLVVPQMDLQGGEQILDACAAPGGKTTHIAQYLTTGHVTACDLYDHKLRLIEQNAFRQKVGDKVTAFKSDATKIYEKFGAEKFDRILVDAPCSGIGLIRRKPDIRYHRNIEDFSKLASIQRKILDSAAKSLKKNGIMVYSTCTIFDEENFDIIKNFLSDHSDFEQIIISHEKVDIITNGCICITPEMYHTDGFFIAKLRKYR